MDSYWLIERRVIPEIGWLQTEWLSLESAGMATDSDRIDVWNKDAQKAIRFCRKSDALAALDLIFRGMTSSYIVTEHMDASPTAALGQKAEPTPYENALRWCYDRLEGAPEYLATPTEQATMYREIGNVLRGDESRAGTYKAGEFDSSAKILRRIASPAPASGEGMNAAGEITGYVPSSLQKSIAERLMPEGWVIVPREPTDAMKAACDNTPGPMTAYKAWQVMLAAAPVQGETE